MLAFTFSLSSSVRFRQDKTVKSTAMMKKVEEREKKKMDQMKKKLHTDDESEFAVHKSFL